MDKITLSPEQEAEIRKDHPGWDPYELVAEVRKGFEQLERGEYTTYSSAEEGFAALKKRMEEKAMADV